MQGGNASAPSAWKNNVGPAPPSYLRRHVADPIEGGVVTTRFLHVVEIFSCSKFGF